MRNDLAQNLDLIKGRILENVIEHLDAIRTFGVLRIDLFDERLESEFSDVDPFCRREAMTVVENFPLEDSLRDVGVD